MIWKFAVALIALIALGFVSIGAVFCAGTMRVAKRLGPIPAGASEVAITTADKTVLRAWWMHPQRSNGGCVMVLHGIADSHVSSAGFAPLFLAEGYSVLLPNSRAHGDSGGEFVTYGLLERYDVAAWAEWMKSAGCHNIYGLGESLGASILIDATAVTNLFSAIVAEGAYADLRQAAEDRLHRRMGIPSLLSKLVVVDATFYSKWVYHVDFTEEMPVRSIARASTPTLLIHGLADVLTPPLNSQQLAAANPRSVLWLVPGAPHTGAAATSPEEFRNRVLSWFRQHAKM